MSIEIDYSCCISGKKFDPRGVEKIENILINSMWCIGEIGTKGRYIGKPYDLGMISFSDSGHNFIDFLNFLISSPVITQALETADEASIDVVLA